MDNVKCKCNNEMLFINYEQYDNGIEKIIYYCKNCGRLLIESDYNNIWYEHGNIK